SDWSSDVCSSDLDQDRVRQTEGLLPNSVRQSTNPRIGTNPLAVYDTAVQKFARDPPVDVRARDHEGPEKIALATLIHAEVRLEHLRRIHFFIAQLRFAQ